MCLGLYYDTISKDGCGIPGNSLYMKVMPMQFTTT